MKAKSKKQEAIPYTFEDALVFDNLNLFKVLDGSGLINKFKEAISTKTNANDLGKEMFKALRKGDKAKFALELLYLKDPEELKVPTYIHQGLSWLQGQLERKQKDIILPTKVAQGEKFDAK